MELGMRMGMRMGMGVEMRMEMRMEMRTCSEGKKRFGAFFRVNNSYHRNYWRDNG
jgi:hypothetical protein